MYAWVVSGTIQKMGERPVSFDTKWTCQQPRIPYGPYVLSDIATNTLIGAPEGWFDCVRYQKGAAAAAAGSAAQGSPDWKFVMERKGMTPL